MSTAPAPLRVAIIGAGPAGFYAAEALLKRDEPVVSVDMFDRLPTPFGLVRSGVAPDHQKIKSVVRIFERIAGNERFRFFGNVCYGEHLSLDDLAEHYHQVLFTTGAQTDRSIGIPGEDLERSQSATEFVAWYNGHPEFRDCRFDLSQERVVVVGVGNVAVDVARVLCRTPEELEKTDIADYALEALRESSVREVVMLGRRGPAQAAFTFPELKELGDMQDADLVTLREEVELDPISAAALEASPDRDVSKMIGVLQAHAGQPPSGKSKRIVIRFLVSPVEIHDDGRGAVGGVTLVSNELVESRGRISPRPTDRFEKLDAGLVFRSVGYRGVPLDGLPFRDDWGVVPNEAGRVLDGEGGRPLTGLYVAGWIKRGPTGVIGTNKPDAQETAAAMVEDALRGDAFEPSKPTPEAAEALITARQPCVFTYADWRRLDAHETSLGAALGRPRVKLTCVEDMLEALGSAEATGDAEANAGEIKQDLGAIGK
jgi:ferredoxin/flavodoxin---NADP+ reductase